MYSGYLTVSSTKSLHYLYHTAHQDGEHLPLLIWFNGGPYCSSLDGWGEENGPCYIEGNKFVKNPYSWNKLANVLYIESPAGAGFSYINSNIESELSMDDDIAAHDNLIALIDFFNKFPSLRDKDLYISGESYAGIYIPMLAYEILHYNDKCTDEKDKIKLKGIMIGNAYTDKEYEEYFSIIDYAFSHGLLSYENRIDFLNYCINKKEIENCKIVISKFYKLLIQLNLYDYLGDVENKTLNYGQNFDFNYVRWGFQNLQSKNLFEPQNYETIETNNITAYLNNKEVKKALHINENLKWEMCNTFLYQYYDQKNKGSIIYYPDLLNKIKILIFSGDSDIMVPINGSLNWIRNLKLDIIDKWQSWKGKNLDGSEEDEKISGFRIKYKGLSFVSFKGCGHMVVEWRRKNSLYMVNQFLNDIF